jgi:hypothetical protein
MQSSSTESGSFYYKVSGDKVVPGGCLETLENIDLVVFPKHGSMLGGQVVELSGPCFNPKDNFWCRFDDQVVEGLFLSRVKVRCIQPMFMKIGVVSLALSTNGEKIFRYRTTYNLGKQIQNYPLNTRALYIDPHHVYALEGEGP